MQISKYVKTIEYKDSVVLYHTKEHSIIQLPREVVDNRIIIEDYIDEESLEAISEMRFSVDSDSEIDLKAALINSKKLFISVELNLSCNLRCPYCYQSGTHNGSIITDADLDSLREYIEKVYKIQPFTDLYLKILGGEPTLVWDKLKNVYEDSKRICKGYGIRFHLLIDTNGTIIDRFEELKEFESILFTIPLTYKQFHDKVRCDSKGNGTYDLVISNINKIKDMIPESKIVIRFNVDKDNINYFESFLKDIKQKLTFSPLVSVNYTAELNGNAEFGTGLTYEEFVKWSSSVAVDSLLRIGLPVTISPIISIEECQFRSRYSLKLFSDGTVGSCAMSFFDKERTMISDLVSSIDCGTYTFFQDKVKQSMMSEVQCLKCADIFVCGGTCKLPCIKALDSDACAKKLYGISIEDFIPRYIDSQETGNSNLFVVFENGESYR